jgi:hypothetical protein
VHPSPLYKGEGSHEEEMHNTSHEPLHLASSYHLPGAPASSWPPPSASLSLPRGLPKGCVGDENHHRCMPSCCGVSGSLSKAVYFRISTGNGVPGVVMVAVRLRVRGGSAGAVPESLLQDLHDLEVGYVVFIVNACAGA